MTNEIDNSWLAWAAGFFDGEGAIQIARSMGVRRQAAPKKRLWNPQIYLYLRANQVDERPLRRLYEMFGGSLIQRPSRGPTSQPQWVWTVSGRYAHAALKAIRPWLVVKAERADLAIDFHEMCYGNMGWNTRSLRPNGSPGRLKLEEVELRGAFYDSMKSLNLRGKAAMEKEQVIQ